MILTRLTHGVEKGDVNVRGLQRGAEDFGSSESQGLQVLSPFAGRQHNNEPIRFPRVRYGSEQVAIRPIGNAFFTKNDRQRVRREYFQGLTDRRGGERVHGGTLQGYAERFFCFQTGWIQSIRPLRFPSTHAFSSSLVKATGGLLVDLVDSRSSPGKSEFL
jgi:hypothetical protein